MAQHPRKAYLGFETGKGVSRRQSPKLAGQLVHRVHEAQVARKIDWLAQRPLPFPFSPQSWVSNHAVSLKRVL